MLNLETGHSKREFWRVRTAGVGGGFNRSTQHLL